jgi:2-polyprenyl-3-methyl-5-hydroxy-6-metoxy-1,4-benzoquinol methylase
MRGMAESRRFDYGYTHERPTWDHSIVLPCVLRAVQSIPATGAILDIGCGNGAMLAHIQRHGSWSLSGVETSESAVSIARGQGLDVRLSNGDGDLLSLFEQGAFDLVLSVEVIEHVFDPRGLLHQARQLLRPEGRLLLTTPYHGYLKNLLIAGLGKGDAHYNPLWDGGHIKFWSQKTLTSVLAETGFHDICFTGVGRVPFLWRSMVLTALA